MKKREIVPMTADSEWTAAVDEAGFDTRDGFGRKTDTSVMQLPIRLGIIDTRETSKSLTFFTTRRGFDLSIFTQLDLSSKPESLVPLLNSFLPQRQYLKPQH